MGLTSESTGRNAVDASLCVERLEPGERVVALAGNPNVGKSTVFNTLTGMRQHTGNWPGKTVASAQGRHTHAGKSYLLVDLPGAYSLMAHSAEEEVARDFICFGGADATIVVCDATCLERSLNLALQTLEMTQRVVICVNLLDEAAKKQIHIDLAKLQEVLGVPVVGTDARRGKGLSALMDAVEQVCQMETAERPPPVRYPDALEAAAQDIATVIAAPLQGKVDARWTALRLIEGDEALQTSMRASLGWDPMVDVTVREAVEKACETLADSGLPPCAIGDSIVASIYTRAEGVCAQVVCYEDDTYTKRQLSIDRVLTGKYTGIPSMLLLLAVIFWITIAGANVPSRLLGDALFWFQDRLTELFHALHAPEWLHGALVLGVYRVLAWVVSVMLPPMAIFFPLFTLLEDLGYLPRVAFNLDHQFKRCRACGKQALTMCMGFGCNAAGVIGCRIIDSPRERLIAILTNNFVPCNGRFPTLIAIISMFFVTAAASSLVSAAMLTAVIVLGVMMTLLVSRVLSGTLLKGVPSSFTLELPPYRRPQVGRVLVRSVLDRTLFVLGRAVIVAAPAGLCIWLLANVQVAGMSLLAHAAGFLDPIGRFMGLDGVILIAFILGFPANEIVLPIIIMAYTAGGTLQEMGSLESLRTLLVQNGWTWLTAVCTVLFSLMHWPCSTTCLSIKKETGSLKWTFAAIAIPTGIGVAVCVSVAFVARLFGLA